MIHLHTLLIVSKISKICCNCRISPYDVHIMPKSLTFQSPKNKQEEEKTSEKNRALMAVGAGWAGWARPHLFFRLTFNEKGHLSTHYLLPLEYFLVFPTHFEEASYAPGRLVMCYLNLPLSPPNFIADLYMLCPCYDVRF